VSAELAVGAIFAERSYRITRGTLVRDAGAPGDFHPIHHRDDVRAAVVIGRAPLWERA